MTPALRALLLEALAVALVGAVLTQVALPGWGAALAVGALGGLGAWITRMDRWWPLLLATLPPAAWVALRLPVPPWAWALAGAALLLVYGGVYRTQVPLFLSRRSVWDAVLALLPPPVPGRRVRLVDLGSGLGGLPRFIAGRRADADCLGVELAPLPAALAALRGVLRPLPNARLARGDLWQVPLGDVDLAFAFLSPVPMPALWEHVSARLPAGATFVSCEFPVPGREADAVLPVEGSRTLFVYRMPAV